MPIHDWTRVRANRFHDFHQGWVIAIRNALNAGMLPPGYFAMAEQIASGPEPDVIALELTPRTSSGPPAGLTVLRDPPRARLVNRAEIDRYARKADRLTIRHPDGVVVAVIEIFSPGNKSSKDAARTFSRKVAQFLKAGVHCLIVDLFPPGRRDPRGIHKLIWDRLADEPFSLPPDKQLTLAAYSAGLEVVAYVEPVAVGDPLQDMPIFLTPDDYVLCPLEATYQTTWEQYPAMLKGPLLANGGAGGQEAPS
jgi:hypothetical protein